MYVSGMKIFKRIFYILSGDWISYIEQYLSLILGKIFPEWIHIVSYKNPICEGIFFYDPHVNALLCRALFRSYIFSVFVCGFAVSPFQCLNMFVCVFAVCQRIFMPHARETH